MGWKQTQKPYSAHRRRSSLLQKQRLSTWDRGSNDCDSVRFRMVTDRYSTAQSAARALGTLSALSWSGRRVRQWRLGCFWKLVRVRGDVRRQKEYGSRHSAGLRM